MIELLVALAISSFLILGITQIYIDNKRNYAFQQSQADNLESSRFAALLINNYLGKAGYRRTPDQLLETAFPSTTENSDCLAFTQGSSVSSAKAATGVCLRYQPLVSGELDCQGDSSKTLENDKPFVAAPPEKLITLLLKYDIGKGALVCKNLNATKPTEIELLNGIADFRLDFGTGSSDMLDKEIKNFITSTDWTTSQGPIRAARYSILLASRENQRDGDDSKIFADWLEKANSATKTRLKAADNKRIYQVASSTQILRNLMP